MISFSVVKIDLWYIVTHTNKELKSYTFVHARLIIQLPLNIYFGILAIRTRTYDKILKRKEVNFK